MNIIVTLPMDRGGLEHLFEKTFAVGAYWEFKRRPKHMNVGDRLYLVCEGKLRGSFEIEEIEETLGIWVAHLDDWVPIDPTIPMKSFRGFRYASRCTSLNDETRKMLMD